MHSASEILPEYQDINVGDELPLGPGGPVMRVEVLDPPHALAFRTTDQNWVSKFGCCPTGIDPADQPEQDCDKGPGTATQLFYLLFMEPGDLVMERKMLFGIKQRAERQA